MTKSFRRAGLLVVGLVAMAMMGMPREADAVGPFRWLEPQPPREGDPDGPDGTPRMSRSVLLLGSGRVPFLLVGPKHLGRHQLVPASALRRMKGERARQ